MASKKIFFYLLVGLKLNLNHWHGIYHSLLLFNITNYTYFCIVYLYLYLFSLNILLRLFFKQVINDKSMVTSTTSSNNEDKHNHSSSSSSKTAKSHPDRTNEACKSSKMISVIPSKDKSLQNQQVSASTSSTLSSHSHSTSDKNTSSQSQSQSQSQFTTSLQSQFTDLFGTPIQARPSPDSSKFKVRFYLLILAFLLTFYLRY